MSKKSITLRWPPTSLQTAWAIIILFLVVINLYMMPKGFMSETDSGWHIIAWIIMITEVLIAVSWAYCRIIKDIRG